MPLDMQQGASHTARRIVTAVLIAVSVALLVVYDHEGDGGPIHAAQGAVRDVAGQAAGATSALGEATDAVGRVVGDMLANPGALSNLRSQNEDLREILDGADSYRQEADRLRSSLDMKKASAAAGPKARIIARSPNPWERSVTLDCGRDAGVVAGMDVVGSTGVIGQVAQAGARTATVRLLADPQTEIPVIVQSSREAGELKAMDDGSLRLEGLDEDVIPEEGDVVLTSGLGGSFERGLVIGLVSDVAKTANNPNGAIAVAANDSAMVGDEVTVVLPEYELEAAEEAGLLSEDDLAGSAVISVAGLDEAAGTLSALRQQNRALRQMLANADEYRQEAERLSDLLEMKQVSGVIGPIARVVGRSTSAWDQSITIDKGLADGIRSGMTIMGATGVIGQVSHADEHSSAVRLLTDPNSGAAVMIESSRENGIVRGSMSGTLFLEDLDEDVIPAANDVILTSGLGGSYERGLIVGAVVSVNKTTSNPAGTIVVNPNDSASVLEEVIVVFTAPDVAAAEKAAEEAAAAAAAEQAAAQDGSLSDEAYYYDDEE